MSPKAKHIIAITGSIARGVIRQCSTPVMVVCLPNVKGFDRKIGTKHPDQMTDTDVKVPNNAAAKS
jgi:hypothetical protein